MTIHIRVGSESITGKVSSPSSPDLVREPVVGTVTVRTQDGVPPGTFFSKNDCSLVPLGQRIRVTARSARCGSISGATWA